MKRNAVLFAVVLGFAGGVLVRSFYEVGNLFVVAVIACAFAAGIVSTIARACVRWFLPVMFLFAAAAGIVRLELWLHPERAHAFRQFVGEEATVVGMIVRDPEERATNTRMVVEIDHAEVGGETIAPVRTERVVVFTELYAPYRYGDAIAITGELSRPEDFETDAGRIFEYVRYLEKDRIYYQMSFADIEVVDRGGGSAIMRALFSVKRVFVSRMRQVIAEPEQSLASGILFGDRGFSKRLQDAFIATGTIHIVALSGYNITIVANHVMKLLGFLPFFARLWGSVGGIALFVVMTGAQATAVRAGVMASLALLARIAGREYDMARGIALAGFLMVLHNPYILTFDVSFQLSFIATIGIIYFTPALEHWFRRVPETFALREVVSTTVATQIFVLPFLLYKMGIFSVTSLPANLLVLPAIPYAMGWSFVAGLIGFVSPILAWPFAAVAYLLLHYTIGIVTLFAKVPAGFFYIKQFPFILVILAYVFFGWVIWRKQLFTKRVKYDIKS